MALAIDENALLGVVPDGFPYNRPPDDESFNLNEAARRLSAWSGAVRETFRQRVVENDFLRARVESVGFVGVGAFWRARFGDPPRLSFGVAIYRGDSPSTEFQAPDSIEVSGVGIPIVQIASELSPQSGHLPNGRMAAYFVEGGNVYALTARHVVDGRDVGKSVEVHCPHGYASTLSRRSPGLIDAAVVELDCSPSPVGPDPVRRAREGEQVLMYLKDGGATPSTVIQTLQTPTEILSAAMPKHFLLDDHGERGDSGSLVSARADGSLLGMLLGASDCKFANGSHKTCGYAVDIGQAAEVLGASGLIGAR